jgi:hypothetical protein
MQEKAAFQCKKRRLCATLLTMTIGNLVWSPYQAIRPGLAAINSAIKGRFLVQLSLPDKTPIAPAKQ